MPVSKTGQPQSLSPLPDTASSPASFRRPLFLFAVSTCILCALFCLPLLEWVQFAFSKQRETYLVLVPVITLYLIRTHRHELKIEFNRSFALSLIPVVTGIISLCLLTVASAPVNRLAIQIFSLLCFIIAAAFLFLGAFIVRQIAFPIAFLIFSVPVPTVAVDYMEIFLQYTSAEAAYWLMSLINIPMIRDGVNFRLPNMFIQVAQECSGYNSTFALFIVSLVAGYMFLKSKSKRTILSVAVVPLAILRNGFRVATLSALCVFNDPEWINSPLHHSGGPIFFSLSLIPFLGLLWMLRKFEISKEKSPNSQ
jgi:exosortase